MLKITSDSNKQIKKLKQLSKKKFRQKYSSFIVEGIRIVEQMLERKDLLEGVYISDSIVDNIRVQEISRICDEHNIKVYSVDDKVFKTIAETDNTQGILAEVSMPTHSLKDLFVKDVLNLVIIDKVQDPGNMGTIIRTADAAGFDAILVIKGSVDIYNDKTLRSTMGSIITMPIIFIEDVVHMTEQLKANGVKLIATSLDTDKYHFDVSYGKKNAVIVGNEGNGVDQDLLDISDIRVKIPMIGSAESLNVAVASGIIIYEIVKEGIIQKI